MLHVASPSGAAIHAISAMAATRQSADDLNGRLITVEMGGEAGLIVQGQGHFGKIPSRPGGGAREDHVFKLGRAHPPGRALTHGPAQRLNQIGLAAAVGPNDSRQPRLDPQFGRFNEGLEASNAQAGDLQRISLRPLK